MEAERVDDLLQLVRGVEPKALHQPEPGPHGRREQSEAGRRADQGEPLERHGDGLRVWALGDPHVHPEVLHGRIEELLQRRLHPVDLVDEQHVARAERGEQPDQVAGLLQHRTRRGAELNAHLPRHQHRQGGLAQPRRSEEQRVVEGLAAALGGVDRDLEGALHLGLADELIEPGRPQRRVGAGLLGEGFRGGNLELRHGSR